MEKLLEDIRHKYYLTCEKEHVNMLPLLHKIHGKHLNLTGYALNSSLARAFVSALRPADTVLTRITLESNSLHDDGFHTILTGLKKLHSLKSIVYIRNEFMQRSVEALIPLLSLKAIPYQLEELRLVNCVHMTSLTASALLDGLNEKSFIKKLSLVNASINDEICVKKLATLISTSR